MVFFLAAALLTGLVVFAIGRPLFRGGAARASAHDHNLTVYQDQLSELSRDMERGLISEDEAAAARAEIGRRLLAEQKAADAAKASADGGRAARMAGLAALGLAPLLAGAIYLGVGAPGAPDQPLAARTDARTAPPGDDGMHAEMEDLLSQLEARLAENPEDVVGWAMLARSRASLRQYDAASAAYSRAYRLTEGEEPRIAGEYAEARVLANDGVMDMEAFGIFQRLLARDEKDPQARYYLALAKAQSGDADGALADWRALLADTPADAPWVRAVQAQITEITGETFAAPQPSAAAPTTPATAPTPPSAAAPSGPNAEQMAAAAAMSESDRAAMIEGMVARLAARLEENPDDLEGWRRLARAYAVMGRDDDARRANEQILRLAPGDAAAEAALGRSE